MFKKIQFETIAKIPLNISLEQVEVWFQDEARFGQQNTTIRIWAQKGSRPKAIKQQQFTYAYAVCISRIMKISWISALELGIGLEVTQKEYYFYAIEIGLL